MNQLRLEYSDIYYLKGDHLSVSNEIKHVIYISIAKPVHPKSFRLTQIHKGDLRNQLSKMPGQGIILPSNSLVLVVPKKLDAPGKQIWRVVVDYRGLNGLTINDK